MNGTVPPGPAPLPDNDDKNKPMPQGAPMPPVGGSPKVPSPSPAQPSGVLSAPPPPPSPPKATPPPVKPLPPPPPPPIGGPAVPPPPGHEVDIRTMASDAKSLKSSGGLGVEPKTFDPSDLTKDPAFKPQANAAPKTPKPKKRIVLISVAIVVVLALTAAVVFFFVLPLFSPQGPSVVVDETPLPPPPPPEPSPAFTHESFFTVAPSDSQTVNIESITLNQINSAFVAGTPLPSGLIREVSFNTDGGPMNAQDFLAITLPGLTNSFFGEDFTSFVYSDGENMWPGYIFRLADGEFAGAAEATTRQTLESDAILDTFYVTPPGAPDEGGFRDGSVGLIETRYLPFGEADASFNYGWRGDYLILSTSFAGFQKAVELLEGGS